MTTQAPLSGFDFVSLVMKRAVACVAYPASLVIGTAVLLGNLAIAALPSIVVIGGMCTFWPDGLDAPAGALLGGGALLSSWVIAGCIFNSDGWA